jgi:hypothetical protein
MFQKLANLHYCRMHDFILFPKGIHISEDNEINIISPHKRSLFNKLHKMGKINTSDKGINTELMKVAICLRLARIINTLHSLEPPIAHGNLNSHNVFIEVDSTEDLNKPFKVQVSEVELSDFKKYANMFYSYRSVSVWSAPECLKSARKRQEPTTMMDVYNFGMLMWEIFHETVPFDGDLKACTQYVVKEDARPKISEQHSASEDGSDEDEEDIPADGVCSPKIAEIIRLCWQTDPSQRPQIKNVAQMLVVELQAMIKKSNNVIDDDLKETEFEIDRS